MILSKNTKIEGDFLKNQFKWMKSRKIWKINLFLMTTLLQRHGKVGNISEKAAIKLVVLDINIL